MVYKIILLSVIVIVIVIILTKHSHDNFSQRRHNEKVYPSYLNCKASSGNDSIGYKYPVKDPNACICSDWHPDFQPDPIIGAATQHHIIKGAPWGLAFLGLSFQIDYTDKNTPSEWEAPVTGSKSNILHNNKYDLNRVQDRAYQYFTQTNDDGWLCGGGQGVNSTLLPNKDSAHMELIHLQSIFDNTDDGGLQPNLSSYDQKPEHVTGWNIYDMINKIRNIKFDPLFVTITDIKFVPSGNEIYIRCDDVVKKDRKQIKVNENIFTLYDKLINEFIDCQVLGKGDPFHITMAREPHFCSRQSQDEYLNSVMTNTINPWIEWALASKENKNGVTLNSGIERYDKVGVGGFYLFYTRNRPIVYFSPSSKAYYCKWIQNGKEILFADPAGEKIEEYLIYIDNPVNIPMLRYISELKYSFSAMPTHPEKTPEWVNL